MSVLENFFQNQSFPLCTTFEGLDLPPATRDSADHLHANPGLSYDHFDRLLVYTDGSSMSGLRHQPPLQLDEQGHGDTWASVVIGKVYNHANVPGRYLVGWQTQPVIYDEDSGSFVGAQHAGSDASAEREALFWSMSWGVSINDRAPTTFCTDSQLTKTQATGEHGASSLTESYRLLRGIAQTLSAIMTLLTWRQRLKGPRASTSAEVFPD